LNSPFSFAVQPHKEPIMAKRRKISAKPEHVKKSRKRSRKHSRKTSVKK